MCEAENSVTHILYSDQNNLKQFAVAAVATYNNNHNYDNHNYYVLELNHLFMFPLLPGQLHYTSCFTVQGLRIVL